jgi:hypothetical protein
MLEGSSRKEFHQKLLQFKGKEDALLNEIKNNDNSYFQVHALSFAFATQKEQILKSILTLEIPPTIASKLFGTIVAQCEVNELIDFLQKAPKGLQNIAIDEMMKLKKKELIQLMLKENPLRLERATLVRIFHGASSEVVAELLVEFENEGIRWLQVMQHHQSAFVKYLQDKLSDSGEILTRHDIWHTQLNSFPGKQWYRAIPKTLRKQLLELYLKFPPLKLKNGVKAHASLNPRCYTLEMTDIFVDLSESIEVLEVLSLLQNPPLSKPGIFSGFRIRLFECLFKRKMRKEESAKVLEFVSEKANTLLSRVTEYHDGYEDLDEAMYWTQVLLLGGAPEWLKTIGLTKKFDVLRNQYRNVFKNDITDFNQVVPLVTSLTYQSHWSKTVEDYISKKVVHFFNSFETSLYDKLGNIVEEFANGVNVDQKLSVWGDSYKSHLAILNFVAETLLKGLDSCPLEYSIPIQKQIFILFSTTQKSLDKLQNHIGSLAYRQNFSFLDSHPLQGPLKVLVDHLKPVYDQNYWIAQWNKRWQDELFQYVERALLFETIPTKYENDLYAFLSNDVIPGWYLWLQMTNLKDTQFWMSRCIAFLKDLEERTADQPLEQRLGPNSETLFRQVFGGLMPLSSRYIANGLPIHEFFHLNFLRHCFEMNRPHDWKQFKPSDLSKFFYHRVPPMQNHSNFSFTNTLKLDDVLGSEVIDLLVDLGVQSLHATNVTDYRVKAMLTILNSFGQNPIFLPLVLRLVTSVVEKACSMPALNKVLRMYSLENWKKGMEENLDKETVFEHLYLYRLSVMDPKVRRYIERKQSLYQDLAVKISFFQRVMDAALMQSKAFPQEQDFVLEVSKWIQPLTTRVEWHLKGIAHPFLSVASHYAVKFDGSQIPGITSDDRPALTPNETVSHTKLVLEHLKSLCEDRFRSEPLKYVSFINGFTDSILGWSFYTEYAYKHNQKYRIGQLPFLEERLEVREIWTRFAFELQFDAAVKSRGMTYAFSNFSLPWYVARPRRAGAMQIPGMKKGKIERKAFKVALKNMFIDVENLIYSFVKEVVPTYPLSMLNGGEYNHCVRDSIEGLLVRSLRHNAITEKSVETLQVLTNYLTTSTDKRDSDLWKHSLDTFQNLSIKSFLLNEADRLVDYSGKLGFERIRDIPFPHIVVEDYYDKHKVAFLVLYSDTCFKLWSNEMKPQVEDWIFFQIALAQYMAPNQERATSRNLVVNAKLSCAEKLLALCPSAAALKWIQDFSLSYRPSLILDVMQREYNNHSSKLYSKGIFNSDTPTISPRLIFKLGGNLTKWTPEQRNFMMKVCRDCLLDKNESIQRKVIASEWLGKGKISSATVIHDLFIQLLTASQRADDPVPFEPIIKKNLLTGLVHQVDEFTTVLRIILTKEILEDRDVNVFLIDALSGFGKLIGDQFTSALRNALFSAEGLLSNLGVAAMKALVRLIKGCPNSVDILIHLFKGYRTMNESVACYLFTTINEILNDENENHETVWGTLTQFVDEQTKVDNKTLALFAVLLNKYPPDHFVDVQYLDVFSPSSMLQYHIQTYNLMRSPAPREKVACMEYFEKVIFRVYAKTFTEWTPLTEKLRCMALCAFPNWFGMDSSLNLRIIETVMSYCDTVLMPWNEKEDTGFLTVSVPELYRFILQSVAYYNNLKTNGLPFEERYLSITDVYASTIDGLFSKMKSEVLPEQEKYSHAYKLDLILGLNGMKKRIAKNLDENDVVKKRKVHQLIGNVYDKISSLPK